MIDDYESKIYKTNDLKRSSSIMYILKPLEYTSEQPKATTRLSRLPIIVLEVIFSYFDSLSIEHLYEADPYVEHMMDGLLSIRKLKERLNVQEEILFRKSQFALWRERLKVVYGRNQQKND